MFLPNLQKNILELERQISRLETECENMGRRESASVTAAPVAAKPPVKDSVNQPFITGPSISATTYSAKMMSLDPAGLGNSPRQAPKPQGDVHFNESPKPPEKKSKTNSEDTRPESRCSSRGSHRSPECVGDQKRLSSDRTGKSHCKRAIPVIREVSESSDEFSHQVLAKAKNKLKETQKENTWCELLGAQISLSKCVYNNKELKEPPMISKKDPKASSDEECFEGDTSVVRPPEKKLSGECEALDSTRSKRRSRRTKRNVPEELLMDGTARKSLQEKETQCLLWNEEKGKGEFFVNVNESVRILQRLIEELRKKTSQEKKNDVLNNMQNTLKKITDTKEIKAAEDKSPPPHEAGLKQPEGAESIANMKNALFAVKKICEELANEKSALAEEISVKNISLSNFKAKEKEYLAVIASLKCTVEKQKEAAEEGARAKKDLKILTVKLQEEAKVIEALKKSHEKMQELVENYVLENDKLKAHVKITKLESQKYNVLLAGKDAEIVKYKREIESFQKQITEQLCLLRSRATETEVQQTIEAISNQATILRKEDPPGAQDCDVTPASSSTKTQSTSRTKELQEKNHVTFDTIHKGEWESESKLSTSSNETQKLGGETKSAHDSVGAKSYVLSNPNDLRSSINELLQDIKRESSDVYWLSAPNSGLTSTRSTSNVTSSEDASDACPKD